MRADAIAMLDEPRCRSCRQPITDWQQAGRLGERLLHKDCWLQMWRAARDRGEEMAVLKSPYSEAPRSELLILAFALMFHIGIGMAVAGWVMVTQGHAAAGVPVLAPGLLMPPLGAAGIARSLLRRRRDEMIKNDIERRGGWKPLP